MEQKLLNMDLFFVSDEAASVCQKNVDTNVLLKVSSDPLIKP